MSDCLAVFFLVLKLTVQWRRKKHHVHLTLRQIDKLHFLENYGFFCLLWFPASSAGGSCQGLSPMRQNSDCRRYCHRSKWNIFFCLQQRKIYYIKSKHNPNDFPDRCINQRGSYTCLCESGFAFDSTNTTCLPIDLCLTGDHGRSFTIDTFENM